MSAQSDVCHIRIPALPSDNDIDRRQCPSPTGGTRVVSSRRLTVTRIERLEESEAGGGVNNFSGYSDCRKVLLGCRLVQPAIAIRGALS